LELKFKTSTANLKALKFIIVLKLGKKHLDDVRIFLAVEHKLLTYCEVKPPSGESSDLDGPWVHREDLGSEQLGAARWQLEDSLD